jgi:hypothetical protein
MSVNFQNPTIRNLATKSRDLCRSIQKSQPRSQNPMYPRRKKLSVPHTITPRSSPLKQVRDRSPVEFRSDRAVHPRRNTTPALKSRTSREISWRSRHRSIRWSPDPRRGDPTHKALGLMPLRATTVAAGQRRKLECVRSQGIRRLQTLKGGGGGARRRSVRAKQSWGGRSLRGSGGL